MTNWLSRILSGGKGKKKGTNHVPQHPGRTSPEENFDWTAGGIILDDYLIEKELGRGGMGRVWLVKSRSTERLFAVKQVLIQDESHRKAFLTELQTWIDLPEHPNVVPCRFFRTVGNEIVIFADFVEGGSLADWIAKQKLKSLEQVLDVAIQFAWGLHAIHECGLIHQDVKPGNVLMTADGVPMVTDFGLARARMRSSNGSFVQAPGQQSVLLSSGGMTPAYASPEQRAGQPLSRKTDIWSWGVSVLDMFMGETSCRHGGHIAAEVLDSFINTGQEENSLPEMPEDLGFVLRKCFDFTPEERWKDFIQVIVNLKGIYERSCGNTYKKLSSSPLSTAAMQPSRSILDRYIKTPDEWLAFARRAAGLSDSPVAASAISQQGSLVRAMNVMSEACRLFADIVADGRREVAEDFVDASWVHADLHRRLSDWNGCIAVFKETANLLSKLAGDDNELRSLLAKVLYWQAELLLNSGKPEAAYHCCRNALTTLFSIPPSRERLLTVTETILLHGKCRAAQGLTEEARTDYRTGIENLQDFAAQFPGDDEIERALALGLHNWAVLERQTGDKNKAVDLYQRAIGVREALLSRFPEDHILCSDLAGSYSNIAGSLSELGDLSAALAAAEKGVELREQLIEAGMRLDFSDALARAYFNKAGLLLQLARHEGAVESYSKALEVLLQLVYHEGRTDLLSLLNHARANNDDALKELERRMPEAADKVYSKYFDRFKRLANKDSGKVMMPQLAIIMSNWGGVKESMGRRLDSIALVKDAKMMLEQHVGERPSEQWCEALAMVYLNYGSALDRAGRSGEARDFLEKAKQWSLECGALQKGAPLLKYFGLACIALAYQCASGREYVAGKKLLADAETAISGWLSGDRSDLDQVLDAARKARQELEASESKQQSEELTGETRRLVDAAVKHLERRELPEAISIYEQALASCPNNADMWMQLGAAYADSGDTERALSALEKSIHLRERKLGVDSHIDQYHLANSYAIVAQLLQRKGQNREACEFYEKTIAIRIDCIGTDGKNEALPILANDYLNQCKALWESGQRKQAQAVSDKAIAILEDQVSKQGQSGLSGSLANAYVNAACIEANLGRLSAASGYLNQAIALYEQVKQGGGNKYSGQLAEALRMREQIQSDASRVEAHKWSDRGLALRKEGLLAEALSCYQRALELEPSDADIWVNLGAAYLYANDGEQALLAFETAINLNPENSLAWHNKGAILYAKSRYKEALNSFQQAEALGHSNSQIGIAQCQRKLKSSTNPKQ